MPDHEDRDAPEARSTNKPMYGERRPLAPALLGVIALVIVVLAIFAVITIVRYTT